eukprot:GHVS01006055.1.p1 GENE.GHVS01006055.1~~GHVS01006055.1.p1  ORF type:complete len:893 (+),score=209.44 GHVS01006055.1:191-2680(+)
MVPPLLRSLLAHRLLSSYGLFVVKSGTANSSSNIIPSRICCRATARSIGSHNHCSILLTFVSFLLSTTAICLSSSASSSLSHGQRKSPYDNNNNLPVLPSSSSASFGFASTTTTTSVAGGQAEIVQLEVLGYQVGVKVTVGGGGVSDFDGFGNAVVGGGQDLLLVLDTAHEGIRLFVDNTPACFNPSTVSFLHASSPTQQEQEHHNNQQQHHNSQQQHHNNQQQHTNRQQQSDNQEQHTNNQQQHTNQQQRHCYVPTNSTSPTPAAGDWCEPHGQHCVVHKGRLWPFVCRLQPQMPPLLAALDYSNIAYNGLTRQEDRLESVQLIHIDTIPFQSPNNNNSWCSDDTYKDGGCLFPVSAVTNFTAMDSMEKAYELADGVWGIGGPSLCCRDASPWYSILSSRSASSFALDININTNSTFSEPNNHLLIAQQQQHRDYGQTATTTPTKTTASLPRRLSPGHAAGVADNPTDSNNHTAESTSWAELHLGNASPIPANTELFSRYGDVVWSERAQTGDMDRDGLYGCTVYGMNVCGVGDILKSASSNWEMIIDIGSSCLVLPTFAFARLMQWLPVDRDTCVPDGHLPGGNNHSSHQQDHKKGSRLCKVDSNRRPLPALRFSLRERPDEKTPSSGEGQAPGGIFDENGRELGETDEMRGGRRREHAKIDELEIPLEDLVYYDKSREAEVLCVSYANSTTAMRSTEEPGWQFYSSDDPFIKFGTLALRSLYVVVDRENSRLGFAQKPSSPSHETSCSTKPVCRGDQQYHANSNICVDPSCSSWLLKSFNDETKLCEVPRSIVASFVSCVVTLAIADILSYYFYTDAVKKAQALCR